jgi:hypothetical protein
MVVYGFRTVTLEGSMNTCVDGSIACEVRGESSRVEGMTSAQHVQ